MELGRSLDWQICRARTTQDAIREAGRTSEHGFEVGRNALDISGYRKATLERAAADVVSPT